MTLFYEHFFGFFALLSDEYAFLRISHLYALQIVILYRCRFIIYIHSVQAARLAYDGLRLGEVTVVSGGDGKHAQIVSRCHKVACGVETHLLDALAIGYLHRGYAYAVAVAIARGEHGADIIGPCHIVELKQSVLVVHHQGGAVGTHCHATARHAAQQVSVQVRG